MAGKRSGLGMNVYVGGVDMSGDTCSINNLAGPRGTFDMTDVTELAYERVHGKRDGSVNLTSFFNKATDRAHLLYSPLPTADRDLMVTVGTTVGDPAASLRAKQLGYDGSREADGKFLFTIEAQANTQGLDWGRLLTNGRRSDTTATVGSSLDMTVGSTSFGLTAWLQVFAFTGTSATVTIQQSSDNGAGDAFTAVTGGAFTAVTTAPGTQRIATANNLTVERYLRVATTGTFTALTFAVQVLRHESVMI